MNRRKRQQEANKDAKSWLYIPSETSADPLQSRSCHYHLRYNKIIHVVSHRNPTLSYHFHQSSSQVMRRIFQFSVLTFGLTFLEMILHRLEWTRAILIWFEITFNNLNKINYLDDFNVHNRNFQNRSTYRSCINICNKQQPNQHNFGPHIFYLVPSVNFKP